MRLTCAGTFTVCAWYRTLIVRDLYVLDMSVVCVMYVLHTWLKLVFRARLLQKPLPAERSRCPRT
jgi:hypothetical protein